MKVDTQQLDRCEERGLHPEAIRAAREALAPEDALKALAETFSALGDPTRMKLLLALAAAMAARGVWTGSTWRRVHRKPF